MKNIYMDIGEMLAPLLFFGFVGLIALIKKLVEQRQTEEQKRSSPRVRVEELPGRTRRLLYGESVPTARPRQHPGQAQEAFPEKPSSPETPQARPIEVRDLLEALMGEITGREASPAPGRKPAPEPAQPKPEVSVFRRSPEEGARRPAPPRITKQAPPARALQPSRASQPGRTGGQRAAQPKQPAAAGAGRPSAAGTLQQRRPQQGPARVQQEPAQRHERPRRRHPLLAHLDDVRRGIVMREVLGPPKGLQDWDSR